MSVAIGNGVTSIGKNAFDDCDEQLFDTTTIPDVKMLDGWVIRYTTSFSGDLSLTGIRGIEDGAFSECNDITSVTISNGVTSTGS